MLNNKAQSIFEYVALAMLIIVGTVVMGPYLLRSVNSNFKLWQDSVGDSTHDRMQKSDMTITAPCSVGAVTTGSCGPHAVIKGNLGNSTGPQACKLTEQYQATTCVGSGTCCLTMSGYQDGCVTPADHDTCCGTYNSFSSVRGNLTNGCGNVTIASSGIRSTDPSVLLAPLSSTTPSDYQSYCHYDEEVQFGHCLPDSPGDYKCKHNPSPHRPVPQPRRQCRN